MTPVGSVVGLFRFPVKSMQGEQVPTLAFDQHGAVGDRRYGVIDTATGKVLSAKRHGELLEARATLYDGTGTVTITLPDGSTQIAGDATTDAALSAWLGRAVHLARPDPDTGAPFELLADPIDDESEVWDFATPPNTFVDVAGAHLLTTASLAAAAALAPDTDWSVYRFRPTVLIDADVEAGFVEDDWVELTVGLGTVAVEPFMRTPRCSLPPRAQRTNGLPRDTAVSRVLTDHHGHDLGLYASVVMTGTVAIGDPVTTTPRRA
ncbi:MAG: MOSC N-terminal beta barrel domain-containing protein [Acidimicrobiales bacterium]